MVSFPHNRINLCKSQKAVILFVVVSTQSLKQEDGDQLAGLLQNCSADKFAILLINSNSLPKRPYNVLTQVFLDYAGHEIGT